MNSHPQFDEDFELYELGVLDGSDRAELEAHLAGCPECRAKLEAARGRMALLALAVPQISPPDAVGARILESFREHGPKRSEEAPTPAARRGPSRPVWAWVWAAACIVVVVAAAWLARENSRLTKRMAELELIHQQLVASSQDQMAAAARAQAVLDVLTGPQTVQVELAPETAHPVPHGKAFYNRDRGLLFYTTSLDSLPADRIYELWLIPTEGAPVEVGIFNSDAQGNGQLILPTLPHGLTAKAFAVTNEPAGGVPAPTTPILLVGPVS